MSTITTRNLGVKGRDSLGAIASLKAAVESGIRIGVHRHDLTSNLESPVPLVRSAGCPY